MNAISPELTDAERKPQWCLDTHHLYSASISILADDGRTYGFATSQYVDFVHEANPGMQNDSGAPPERMRLRFATAEVMMLGSRLELIASALSEGQLRGLKAISQRYARALKSGPLIFSIAVAPKNDL